MRDPQAEECDDGAGATPDMCTPTCRRQDVALCSTCPPTSEQRAGTGRHTVAASDSGLAATFIDILGANRALKVQQFSGKGQPGATFDVGTGTVVKDSAHPVVAALSNDRLVVAWSAPDQDSTGIALRQVTAAAMGPLTWANKTMTFGQREPDVLWTGTELVVAWVDDSNPDTAPDLRIASGADVAALSVDMVLADSFAAEGGVALFPYGSSYGAAWRVGDAGLEAISLRVGSGPTWLSADALPGAPGDKPAVAEMGGGRVAVVYSVGTAETQFMLSAALVDVATGATVSTADVGPAVGASAPVVARADGKTFLAFRTEAPNGDPLAAELWLGQLTMSGDTLALGAPVPLPRQTSHRAGNQDRPSLVAAPLLFNAALAATWEDFGLGFDAGGHARVGISLIPVPVVTLTGEVP